MNEIALSKVERLRALHSEILGGMKKTIAQAIEAGGILAEIKAELPHGSFIPWVKENTGIDIRTAQNYMRAHKNRDRLQGKYESVSHLGEAYALLTEHKPKEAAPSPEQEETVKERQNRVIKEYYPNLEKYLPPKGKYTFMVFDPPSYAKVVTVFIERGDIDGLYIASSIAINPYDDENMLGQDQIHQCESFLIAVTINQWVMHDEPARFFFADDTEYPNGLCYNRRMFSSMDEYTQMHTLGKSKKSYGDNGQVFYDYPEALKKKIKQYQKKHSLSSN